MSNWKDKVVVVTGGSKGLGRAIALAFAQSGATTVIMARDLETIQQTIDQTQSDWSQRSDASNQESLLLYAAVGDVTSTESITSAVAQILQQHGRIDVWVNNVGKSIRTDIRDATLDQYRDLMEINFFSAVRCTQLVLSELEKSSGHLVNIGSLASKTAWPWVAPYTTSKFALSAYTAQLRLEGPKNVHYLLVCPGPLVRDDSNVRYQQQSDSLPETANKPGAGAPVKGIQPERLAEKIVLACQRRKSELIIPGKSKILFVLNQISTRLGDALLKRLSR